MRYLLNSPIRRALNSCNNVFLFCMALLLTITSCKKENKLPDLASLNLINAVVDCPKLITNFKGTEPIDYYLAGILDYNRADDRNMFSVHAGTQRLGLYKYNDTGSKSKPLYDLTLDLPVGSVHSLFLTGTVSEPEMLLVKDALPYHALADSTMGVRFVNLSKGDPVSVNIINKANGSEVSQLAYKESTAFTIYPARIDIASYVFEFRDAASGTLITSFTTENKFNPGSPFYTYWIYRNFTMALVGKPGGVGAEAQSVLVIYHKWY